MTIESEKDREPCPECKLPMEWTSMVQRDRNGADPKKRMQTGYKIAPDLSASQAAYMDQPEVKEKLRTGEYEIPTKGSDCMNHR